MSQLDALLDWNRRFVETGAYEPYATGPYPDKKLAVLTCMDTRLTELLPRAMNIKNGEAKIIKIAGAWLTDPHDAAMKSLLVGVALLQVEEVFVVGHYDCGMAGEKADRLTTALTEQGIELSEAAESLGCSHLELEEWLRQRPADPKEAVRESVRTITSHPLMPSHIPVHGLVIDPHTGKLDILLDGRVEA